MRGLRLMSWFVGAFFVVGVVVLVGLQLRRAGTIQPQAGVLLQSPQPVENLTLTTTEGERVDLATLRGDHYQVLFFGYTYCPDVCPTTMTTLKRALAALGPAAERVQVVMVSVDPERDTPERLADYVHAFDPRFKGLTGTPEEIQAAASQLGVFAAKRDEAASASEGYLVDHTATVLVLDPAGHLRMLFPFDVSSDAIAADLRLLMAQR